MYLLLFDEDYRQGFETCLKILAKRESYHLGGLANALILDYKIYSVKIEGLIHC